MEPSRLRLMRFLSPANRSIKPDLSSTFEHIWPLDLTSGERGELLTAPEAKVCLDGELRSRPFLRYAPEFVDDPADRKLFSQIGTAVYRSPPPFFLSVPNAALVGYRTILFADRFTSDAQLEGRERDGYDDLLASADPFLNEETGLKRRADGAFELDRGARAERHLSGPHIVLCSHEPANYGSFLFRVAPKITNLRHAGLDALPIVVHAGHPNVLRLLELLGVDRQRIVQHRTDMITTIDRAIAPGLRNPHAYLDRESALLLQALGERFSPGEPHRKLYVSRRSHARHGGSTRVLQNEEELARRLEALGFEIVEPEGLGMDAQIALFASAKMVIGPSGSAMFNVVFCRPGTKVIDIESEDHWIYAHTGLFASCQLRYGLFTGAVDPTDDRSVHRRWTVDVDALLQRVERFVQN